MPESDEQRKMEDRRKGDRRTGVDRRNGGISVTGQANRRQSGFLDRPIWVAFAIIAGFVLGVVVMAMTNTRVGGTARIPQAISAPIHEVELDPTTIIVPANDEESDPVTEP